MDVAAHIPGRDAHRTRDCDEEVCKVLADAGLQLQHFVNRRIDVGHSPVISELATDGQSQLVQGLLHRLPRCWVVNSMPARQLAHARYVIGRRSESEEVEHEVLALVGLQLAAGLDHGPADHAQALVVSHEVEVVDVVPIAVHVRARAHLRTHVEPELEAALAAAVHWTQPHLHDRLGDRCGVPKSGGVYDLEPPHWRSARR